MKNRRPDWSRRHENKGKAGVPRKQRAAGFSLAELMLMVAMLAILGGIAVNRYSGSIVHHELSAAARRVQADLELCRQQAIASGASKTAQFVSGTGRYSFAQLADINRPGQNYSVDLAVAPYEVTIGKVDFDGWGAATITFDAYGKPVYAQALGNGFVPSVVLSTGGRSMNVAVDPSSGRAYLP